MNQLIAYLRDNLILDFQGDLTIEGVREFLKNDDTRDAKSLMAKLVADAGSSEMMLVLATHDRELASRFPRRLRFVDGQLQLAKDLDA